ncbi:MAG: hypothetical protein OXU23_03775 [Candidatus Poribacteria bacterium]|nr:hypothetical protein [Candidatus Poribacteria bacterium]
MKTKLAYMVLGAVIASIGYFVGCQQSHFAQVDAGKIECDELHVKKHITIASETEADGQPNIVLSVDEETGASISVKAGDLLFAGKSVWIRADDGIGGVFIQVSDGSDLYMFPKPQPLYQRRKQ